MTKATIIIASAVLMICASLLSTTQATAQTAPEITAWKLNTTGATGYKGLPADVQRVRYSSTNVYVNCSSIPSYTIGPWPMNPNDASNQAYVFRIPRNPQPKSGTKTSVGLGQIGVFTNGVVLYNALDANSYQNKNIWHQNAVVVEGPSFDACFGHPPQNGAYHHHQNPKCLYTASATQHSPIVGYSFDGYPIYGSYAYANLTGGGGITRIKTSYRTRSITKRQTAIDGTALASANYGPDVSTQYPLGYYSEDYEYVKGLGDLDEYNGRTAITPEYPQGTYAYYVTIDASGKSEYPYVIGPQYNGTPASDDLGMGRATVSEATTDYTGKTSIRSLNDAGLTFFPNPVTDMLTLEFGTPTTAPTTIIVRTLLGQPVQTLSEQSLGMSRTTIDVSSLAVGVYALEVRIGSITMAQMIVKH